MENLNPEIKNKIIAFLRKQKLGASSSEISKKIGHNRITVTKYLEIMKANGVLNVIGVAQAKLWTINRSKDKPTVLIVDDEPNVVDLVALSLIEGKFNIIKAYSGLDALEKIYQGSPDIIILDLMMPGVDGYEVCKRVKENPVTRHIPIMMLSAKGELNDKLTGMNSGADDYLTKPFDPMELEARVNVILRRVKQDIDTHPLTKLPGRISLMSRIQKIVDRKEKYSIVNYSLKNIRKFKKKYGFRKTDDAIMLIGRIFSDVLKDKEDAFISHTLEDSFVIITNDEKTCKMIEKSFSNVLPYIYSGESEKEKIELVARDIALKDIAKNIKDLDKIYKLLGV